jgi:hypothetical protein
MTLPQIYTPSLPLKESPTEENNQCTGKKDFDAPKGLFGKWRNQVDGRGLEGILGNFDL